MAEEAPISETTIPAPVPEQNQNSVNATIVSEVQGGTESTCNNDNKEAESSAVTSDGDREKSLEYAEELMVKGSKASKDGDYGEAVDCYSRALEIRLGFSYFISITFLFERGCLDACFFCFVWNCLIRFFFELIVDD